MPAASILIKPASANCNIDCKYCFYKCLSQNREEYSKGFMSDETLEHLVKNAVDYAEDVLTFAFQGGEPMLAGLDFYQRVIELQMQYGSAKKGLRIENTLQTNGVLIDEHWAEFFAKHHFLVGVSLDGPKKLHDEARLDASGMATFERVMNGISILKKYQVEFNILTVVKESTTQKASALYKFYQRNDFSFVQLIPCMDEDNRQGDEEGANPYAVTAALYGKFLKEFFDLWYEDFRVGKIMDVRMFSNLAQMAVGIPPEECGMCGQCKCYFVVEGDGSVYPCDFYCMDAYRLGSVEEPFQELKKKELVHQFESISSYKPQACQECEYYPLCNGGCRRFREPFVDGKPGLNYLCDAYKDFFAYTSSRIHKLGQTILDPTARQFL